MFRTAAGQAPAVGYAVRNGVGGLDVKAKRGGPSDTWSVSTNSGCETALWLDLGSGNGTVALGDVNVKTIEATTGAGPATFEITNPRTQALDGYVKAGGGKVTVYVLKNANVRIQVAGSGDSTVTTKNLNKGTGAVWFTGTPVADPDAYVPISIRIDRGAGQIELVAK